MVLVQLHLLFRRWYPFPGPDQILGVFLTLESAQAIQQGFAMLKALVGQIQTNKINTPAAQALAVDLKTALQIDQTRTLTIPQKESQLCEYHSACTW